MRVRKPLPFDLNHCNTSWSTRILIWSLGAGMPTIACVQSGSPRTSSTSARIDAFSLLLVAASILSQFVRSSPAQSRL